MKAGYATTSAIDQASSINLDATAINYITATATVPSSNSGSSSNSSNRSYNVTGLRSGMALCSCPLGLKAVPCKHLVAAT
jgi:hypothetical protein